MRGVTFSNAGAVAPRALELILHWVFTLNWLDEAQAGLKEVIQSL